MTPNNEGLNQEKPADKNNGSPAGHQDHTQSRLLTKKQLTDMAFGIRELSKRMGHVKLILKVKTIFLLTKAYDSSLIKCSAEMTNWLLDEKKDYTVYVTVDGLCCIGC